MRRIGWTVLFALALSSIAARNDAQAPGQKPVFEVISITPNNSGERRSRVSANGPRDNIDRFVATNASLRMLALYAYPQLRNDEVVGGPAWIDSDRFDVEAKPQRSTDPIRLRKIQFMLQAMLEDRFQLKAHMETRQLAIYNLVLAKNPPKIKLSEDQTPPPPPTAASPDGPLDRGASTIGKDERGLILSGRAVPLLKLIDLMQGPAQTDRRIFDKTGLTGLFDFQLHFIPEIGAGPQVVPPGDNAYASLFTALQEQLGLKLESSKGTVEVLVIDSVQRPSGN